MATLGLLLVPISGFWLGAAIGLHILLAARSGDTDRATAR
jgi:hypothetical protein